MKALLMILLCCFAVIAPAAAHPPYGLVVDKGGNVYFSDLETVWRLDPDGRLSIFRPHVIGTHVHALALAPDGSIEGDQNHYDPNTERFYSGLWHRTFDGIERAILPLTEHPPPGMGLWQDSVGNRYTSQWVSNSDRRVVLLRRQPDRRVEVLFDESGGSTRPLQASVESVGGMAFGADGSLYFTNGGVLLHLTSGGKIGELYDGGTASSLRGVTTASNGRVLVADMSAKAILVFDRDGAMSTFYRETGPWLPTAIALANERVLVLEANADPYERENRVRIIEVKQGKGAVVASPAQAPERPTPLQSAEASSGSLSIQTILVAALIALTAMFAGWRLYSGFEARS